VVNLMWNWGITSIPPDAFPYLIGSYTMDTSRLRALTGSEYEHIIRYSSEAALTDSNVMARFAPLSMEPVPRDQGTPAALDAKLRAEAKYWSALLKEAGVQPE